MKRFVLLASLACFSAAAPAAAAKPAAAKADDYKARARRELDAFAVKLEALEAEAHTLGAEARERAEERVRGLRVKKSDADRLLAELEAKSGKAGKDVRARLDRAIRDLKAAYADPVSRRP